MGSWVQMVTQVGFPIVCSLALGGFIAYLFKTRISEMDELMKQNMEFLEDLIEIKMDIADIKDILNKEKNA